MATLWIADRSRNTRTRATSSLSPKFKLKFTLEADRQLHELEQDPSAAKRLKAVLKALSFMETNLRHPSLQTHEYVSLKGPNGAKVFESYAEQNTPGAYRIFWCYGPERDNLTILAITPHP